MIERIFSIISLVVIFLLMCGCLYRSDGPFAKIGKSDYKARINFLNIFAVADGRPTYVKGMATLDDRITPIKRVNILLRKKSGEIITETDTDFAGRFAMSGVLFEEIYVLEINSQQYTGKVEIAVKLSNDNYYEIVAYKKN